MRFVFPSQLENFVIFVDGKQEAATIFLKSLVTGCEFPCLIKKFSHPSMDWMRSCLPEHCPMTDSDLEEFILWSELPAYPENSESLLNWQLAEEVFWTYYRLRKYCENRVLK